MNSIEALKLEFNTDISELSKINNDKISDSLIFVGSGDSYVAGLIAEYLTDHKCKCYSPSDLFNSELSKDRTYCFVSVTGKTKANISVAKRASQAGFKTVAVTMNRDSKLAQVCKEIVPLDFKRTVMPISSFSIFTLNVATCLQLAGVVVPQKFDVWYNKGVELSKKFLDSNRVLDRMGDTIVFLLGNNTLYPLALYTSLKMTEFFGTTAVAHKLEERMIITGNISSADLQGPLSGKTIADLQSAINALGVNIDLHTKNHPEGELRGTIRIQGS